ncbi:MAG: VWA domain-containing protein [Bacteroidetes bacterium]|nr:MAG: VWA domain-containing protein [Bacteroidota bacterium]TAG87168.1 MAG: VWA domain-containing protein [Bacteroidota bacterium]
MFESVTNNPWAWFSLAWFFPQTLMNFEWENIYYLYILLAIPFIFIIRRIGNIPIRAKILFNLTTTYPSWRPIIWLRFIPYVALIFCLICLIIALARPQQTKVQVRQMTEGIDILLAMDVSESMLLEDFSPNRLDAAKKVAIEFIKGRKYDRIGLVVFSGEAFSLSPLTTDYSLLENYLSQEVQVGMVPQPETAIGAAIGVATNRLKESNAKSKVVILISDGDNTAGNLDPITATQLAVYNGIKIYPILVGSEGDIVVKDEKGNRTTVRNTANETTLRQIAQKSEGKFFRSVDNQTLSEIFKQIDDLEKSKIIETKFKKTEDFYSVYLVWGIIFFIFWLFTKGTFISNALED